MRVLVDIVLTVEIEMETLDEMDEVVTDWVNAYVPDEIQGWHLDDSFTVVDA